MILGLRENAGLDQPDEYKDIRAGWPNHAKA